MAWRLALFLAWQLVGASVGWWQLGRAGALWGALLACWAWMCLDLWRAGRVLGWLRSGQIGTSPSIQGMWGDASERMRKLLRQSQAAAENSQQRLQEILAALQATPNGVVLLDAQGRIEWCNQTAASQFGIDMPRDVMQAIGNLIRDPDFNAYYAARDFLSDVVLAGRQGTPSCPMRISVHLHPYGDGRTLRGRVSRAARPVRHPPADPRLADRRIRSARRLPRAHRAPLPVATAGRRRQARAE